jgi:hypothetical protein
METFITVMGWLCLCFVLISILCGAVGLAGIGIGKVIERFERSTIATTRHELGRDIQSCAHWFSESTETWVAIKVLGERLTHGYATDVDRWREEWRERVRTHGCPQQGRHMTAMHRNACPICNPDKTVPELNRASQGE